MFVTRYGQLKKHYVDIDRKILWLSVPASTDMQTVRSILCDVYDEPDMMAHAWGTMPVDERREKIPNGVATIWFIKKSWTVYYMP